MLRVEKVRYNDGMKNAVLDIQVSTVRRIKKVVFDGTESGWSFPSGTIPRARIALPSKGIPTTSTSVLPISTHYVGRFSDNSGYLRVMASGDEINMADATNAVDETTWKAYLASEYSAGHPVTIWYVLAEPTTGIVNEPLAKIGDYADELSSTDAGVAIPTAKGNNVLTIDTTLQPSEMAITFKG